MVTQIEGGVKVEYRCAISQAIREILSSALSQMIRAIGEDAVVTLDRILIVEDERVADTANAVLSTVEPSAAYVPSERHTASAVAVPLEYPHRLICVIVLGGSVVEAFAQGQFAVINALSTVLEELLHVWVYTAVWRKRGFLQYRRRNLASCDWDLYSMAFQIVDEYLVIRRKNDLFTSMSLPGVAYGGECGGIKLQYGGDVVAEVSEGIATLKQSIMQAAKGEKEIGKAWAETITITYRGTFEPLCRYAAYEDTVSEEPWEDAVLERIGVAGSPLPPAWRRIHLWLKRAFSTNLDGLDESIEEIVGCLREMLREFGVTYRRLEGNVCWVDFAAKDRRM